MILGTIRIKIRRMKSSALYIHLRIDLRKPRQLYS